MLRYKAGYKYVLTGVHAQVMDFPAAITFADDLAGARQAEAAMEYGQPLPVPNPNASDPEMELEEPIYLHLTASTQSHPAPACTTRYSTAIRTARPLVTCVRIPL